jgi:hypothetical protein
MLGEMLMRARATLVGIVISTNKETAYARSEGVLWKSGYQMLLIMCVCICRIGVNSTWSFFRGLMTDIERLYGVLLMMDIERLL